MKINRRSILFILTVLLALAIALPAMATGEGASVSGRGTAC